MSHDPLTKLVDTLEKMSARRAGKRGAPLMPHGLDVSAGGTSGTAASTTDVSLSTVDSSGMLRAIDAISGAPTAAAAEKMPAEGTPAYRRLQAWNLLREATLDQMRKEREAQVSQQCTFRPKIDKQPTVASTSELSNSAEGGAIEARLAEFGRKREEVLHRKLQERQAEEDRNCTFRPTIHPHAIHDAMLPTDVENRTTESRFHRVVGSDWHAVRDPQCTFHPTIGHTSRAIFHASHSDDGCDVFQRLYSARQRSRSRSPDNNAAHSNHSDPAVVDEPFEVLPVPLEKELSALRDHFHSLNNSSDEMRNFFFNVLGLKANQQPVPVETNFAPPLSERAPSSSNHRASLSPIHVTTTTTMELMNFNEFLERQSEKEKVRKEHLEHRAQELAPTHHPALCPESDRIASTKGRRSVSCKARREEEADRKRILTDGQLGLEAFFNPVISKVAKAAPKRGDMRRWKGDMERREHHLNAAMQQKAQAESTLLSECFRPHTNKNYETVNSILAHNLQGYMSHLSTKRQKAKEMQEEFSKERQQKEMASCTFRPQLNRVPQFITEMAKSLSLTQSPTADRSWFQET